MNTAIIVAAGSGIRFNPDTPKQFLEINGKPLLIHTLERFEACSLVDRIVLVLPAEQVDPFGESVRSFGISKLSAIVAGRGTRAGSVQSGLDAVEADANDIIAVHDGARPLVSVEEIERTIETAADTGAACLVTTVTDTIKEIDGDRIVGTIDRRILRRALTPQAFRYEILQRAFAQGDLGEGSTDECYLVEKLGYDIAAVEGSARNIKITHPEDILIAKTYLKNS